MASNLEYVGTGTFNSSYHYGNSYDVAYPTGLIKGDLLVAVVWCPNTATVWNTTTGWTRVIHNNGDATVVQYAIYTKGATGGETGNATINLGGYISANKTGVMFRFKGLNGFGHVTGDVYGATDVPVTTSTISSFGLTSSNNNPDSADSLAFIIAINDANYPFSSNGSGYTVQASATAYVGSYRVATQEIAYSYSDGYQSFSAGGNESLAAGFYVWTTQGEGVRRRINVT